MLIDRQVVIDAPILDTLDGYYAGRLTFEQALSELDYLMAPPWLMKALTDEYQVKQRNIVECA